MACLQVRLALINAHMDPKDLLRWHAQRHTRRTLGEVLEKFSLIIPQSDVDVGRFRIFGASMRQMPGWCNELKYAAQMGGSVWHLWKPADLELLQLREGAPSAPSVRPPAALIACSRARGAGRRPGPGIGSPVVVACGRLRRPDV